jgi:hypothetical protein
VEHSVKSATLEAGNAAGLTVERVLEEVRRLSFSDPRRLYRKDGTQIPITELDDETAAMISAKVQQ